jgi:hypothetical protein
MSFLDLFAGGGSFSKCCRAMGLDVVSLDIDGRSDITIDIMNWDYKSYPQDTFDVIWSSPPCEKYSKLVHIWSKKEDIVKGWEESDKLISKTLEIIDYFKPTLWFLENSGTGQLPKRDIMKEIPYYIVDYCKYADWGYRKRTVIFTNKKKWKALKCKKDCNSMDLDNYAHVEDVSWTSSGKIRTVDGGMNGLDLRHRVPPELIYSLLLT